MKRRLVLAALAGLLGCNALDIGEPEPLLDQLPDLTFTASISRSTIAVGDSATLSFVLQNNSADTVKMSFAMGCPTLPYVATRTMDVVYPSNGTWACTAAITLLTLAPGEKRVHDLPVHGGAPQPAIVQGAILEPGRYFGYAELTNGMGRTNLVEFTVTK